MWAHILPTLHKKSEQYGGVINAPRSMFLGAFPGRSKKIGKENEIEEAEISLHAADPRTESNRVVGLSGKL